MTPLRQRMLEDMGIRSHTASMRIMPRPHWAHWLEACSGQWMCTVVAPCWSCRRMSAGGAGAAGGGGSNLIGMKVGWLPMGASAVVFDLGEPLRWVASTTQRRSKLAFRPLASATAAVETPGSRHVVTTWRLKSSL